MERLLWVATGNDGKFREVKEILGDLPVRVEQACARVPEVGESFEENATLKAVCVSRSRTGWVMADDSGLAVEALGGAPGVHSARYAGEGAGAAENNEKLLRALQGVADRRARFICVVALASAGKAIFSVRGECDGIITAHPRGRGGFGYDPLFLVPELGRTFAEVAAEEKNALSHRGRALRSFRDRFLALLEQDAASPGAGPDRRRG